MILGKKILQYQRCVIITLGIFITIQTKNDNKFDY